MSLRLVSAAFGCALAFASAPAAAQLQMPGAPARPAQPAQPSQAGLLNGASVEVTLQAMQQAGYTEVEIYEYNGKRHVKGKILNAPVYAEHIYREGNEAFAVRYVVNFGQQSNVSQNWINAWNSRMLFGRFSQAQNGNVLFDMTFHFFGGVSPAYMRETSVVFAHFLKLVFEFNPG